MCEFEVRLVEFVVLHKQQFFKEENSFLLGKKTLPLLVYSVFKDQLLWPMNYAVKNVNVFISGIIIIWYRN